MNGEHVIKSLKYVMVERIIFDTQNSNLIT